MKSASLVPLLRPLVVGALLACAPGLAQADTDAHSADDGVRVQQILKRDLAEGRLSQEDYLLENFRAAFAPERANARYAGPNVVLEHCFTPWIVEYTNAKADLSPAAIQEIERYLRPPLARAAMATYLSPSGLFELNYDTAGANAVPLDDVNPANGIPDFVERCAEYYDTSWGTVVDSLGFTAPVLPGDGSYDCFFAALSAGLYGFTSPLGPGESQITIDNDFIGAGHVFSPDPDGVQLGRAKGVIAHEFKHASQRAQSNWTEGNWLELDANWVMDYVFDTSDIYHAWLSDPTSQIRSPQTRLDDDGGAGYYEDLLWELYMSERFGTQIITDYWQRRDDFGGETVKASYSNTLQAYGSSWDDAYPGLMEYCWFTGSRAVPSFGFEEAANMSRMSLLVGAISSFPYNASTSVDQLAGHHRRFNPGAATGFLRVQFNGDDAHNNFTLSILAVEQDLTTYVVRPPLDANQDADITVTIPFEDLKYVGAIVTNSKRSGGTQSYTLSAEVVGSATDAPTVVPSALDLALERAVPNPFGAATRIDYAIPATGTARIDVFDVRGRRVRRLLDAVAPAGPGAIVWDGRNDQGRSVPAGVYWARLETLQGAVSRKITKLR